jgi:N-acetylglucosaminyldiphosphoundecaprenol N-acetyl-beta-D-mannosaminyltransferase
LKIAKSLGIGSWIVTLNVDIHRQLSKPEYATLSDSISEQAIITADGFPVKYIARHLTGKRFERVTGASTMRLLVNLSVELDIPIVFAGGKYGDSTIAMQKVKANYPFAKVCAVELSFGEPQELANEIIESIDFRSFTLFLGVGALKSEEIIYMIRKRYPQSIFIGCGAGVSFFAGSLRRAPQIIRKLNLEWLYRLSKEPKRLFSRYVLKDFPHLIKMILWAVKTPKF